MSDADGYRRFLQEADRAIERDDWGAVLSNAKSALQLVPDDADATALVRLAMRRLEQATANVPASMLVARRQLTVMFVDLVGSTSIAVQLDPEQFRALLLDFQAACAEIIKRYEGHLAKYMGDGLLVYFGHPVAHEDDARRAVLAGLAMASRVAELGPSWLGRFGVDVTMRVGIHTGLVVIGAMGSDPFLTEIDITGSTVNLAARLESAAPMNGVVVSESTRRLVDGFIDFEPLGPRMLKGFPEPVDVFRALRPTMAATRIEAAARLTPYIGRRRERATLLSDWRQAQHGSFASRTVEGEPGIGKSRLVHWFSAAITRDVGARFQGYCSPFTTYQSLAPIRYLLERAIGIDTIDDAALRQKVLVAALEEGGTGPVDAVPFICELLGVDAPDDHPFPPVTPEVARERTIEGVIGWLAHVASVRPIVVCVEDVHWADPTTQELLIRLHARTVPGLYLLLTSRTPLRGQWDGVAVPSLVLGPLRDDDRRALVTAALAGLDVDNALSAKIALRSDGVPLYVEELSRAFRHNPDSDVEIPSSLADLLTSRFTGLERELPMAQLLATIDAVVPRRFVDILAPDPARIDDDLRHLVVAGLVEDVSPPGQPPAYRFHHALQRDAAYDLQTLSARRSLHDVIATRLRAAYPELEEDQPELLGRHCEFAGRSFEAASHYLTAGRRAQRIAANIEAIVYFRRALRLLEGESERADDLRLDLHIGVGLCASIVSGYLDPTVVEHWDEMQRLLDRVTPRSELMEAVFSPWAFFLMSGRHSEALLLAERLVEMGSHLEEPDLRLGHAVLGESLLYHGRFREALEYSIAGLGYQPMERRLRVPCDTECSALATRGMLECLAGDLSSGYRHLAEAEAESLTLPFPVGPISEAFVAARVAFARLLCGEPGAFSFAERAHEIGAEHGFAAWVLHGGMQMAAAVSVEGPSPDGIAALRNGIAAMLAVGAPTFMPYYCLCLARSLLMAGEREAALESLDQGLEIVEANGERMLEAELIRLRAVVRLELDPSQRTEALEELRCAHRLASEQGAFIFELRAAIDLQQLSPSSDGISAIAAALDHMAPDATSIEIDRARSLVSAIPQ